MHFRPGRLTDGPYTSYDLNTLLRATAGQRRAVLIGQGMLIMLIIKTMAQSKHFFFIYLFAFAILVSFSNLSRLPSYICSMCECNIAKQ